MNFRDRLTKGLLALGFKQEQSKSNMLVFSNHSKSPGMLYFVGPNGALRKGLCKSKSWSLGDPSIQTPFYESVLKASGENVEWICAICSNIVTYPIRPVQCQAGHQGPLYSLAELERMQREHKAS